MNTTIRLNHLFLWGIFIIAIFLNFFATKTYAAVSPNNFQIIINDGSGKTYSPKVTIKVKHSYSGISSGAWNCLPDKIPNDTTTAGVEINNTGQRQYQSAGEGVCINGWSNIEWDITEFDGNAQYGVKTIFFQLSEQGGGNGWATRSIVYEREPVLITPSQNPSTPAPITPTTQPVNNNAGSYTNSDKSVKSTTSNNDQITATTPESAGIEVISKQKTNPKIEGTSSINKLFYNTILRITSGVVILLLIAGSYLLWKKRLHKR